MLDNSTILSSAWAKSQVLCAILDPEQPEEIFLQGRLITAHKLALELHDLILKLKGTYEH